MEPELKLEHAFLIDCHDLDKFVAIHLEGFGVEWRALDTGTDGYHNGSMVSARVAFGRDPEDDLDQDFGRWLTGGTYYEEDYWDNVPPSVEAMLQWLCNEGHIASGTYVVHLWW